LPALELSRSGVAEPGRESARGRAAFVAAPFEMAAFDGGTLLVTAVFFFSGFSGAGHSTSCLRSIRSAETHSVEER